MDRRLRQFLESSGYAPFFQGMPVDSERFRNQWRDLSRGDPGFLRAQHEYTGANPPPRRLAATGQIAGAAPVAIEGGSATMSPKERRRRQADLDGAKDLADVAGHEVGAAGAYMEEAAKKPGVDQRILRQGARGAGVLGPAIDGAEGYIGYRQRRLQGQPRGEAAAKATAETGVSIASAALGGAIGSAGGPLVAAGGVVLGGLLGDPLYGALSQLHQVPKDYYRLYKDWERRQIMGRALGRR